MTQFAGNHLQMKKKTEKKDLAFCVLRFAMTEWLNEWMNEWIMITNIKYRLAPLVWLTDTLLIVSIERFLSFVLCFFFFGSFFIFFFCSFIFVLFIEYKLDMILILLSILLHFWLYSFVVALCFLFIFLTFFVFFLFWVTDD